MKGWLRRWGPPLAVAALLLGGALVLKVHLEASRELAWSQQSPAPLLEQSFAAQQAGASGEGAQALREQGEPGRRRAQVAQAGGRTWWGPAPEGAQEAARFGGPSWLQRALSWLAWLSWLGLVTAWVVRARDEQGAPTRWRWPLAVGGAAALGLWLATLWWAA